MSYEPYARLTQVVDSMTAAPDNYELVETYEYELARHVHTAAHGEVEFR